jgi:glucose-1-phosphate thymidylyltransferase
MKGIVLAGGTGSRLRPITHTGPKQLVPVGNKPVIDYGLEDLREAGIEEVGVVLGNKGREAIQHHLGDGSEFGLDITYIVQGDPLGLAHAVGCARDFVGGEPFVVYLGDNLMAGSITAFVDDFDPSIYAAGIGVQEVDEPSRYGIVDIDDQGEITRLLEKPAEPPTNLALIGVYVFTPAIFDRIESLEPSWRGELEITEAIQRLLEDGYAVQSHVVEGWWKDTGKPEDILHANRQVLDRLDRRVEGTIADGASVRGRVEVGEDSTIEDGAVVRGPVSVGEGTTVRGGAYVGPYTSIGDDCLVSDAHIESSVVIGDAEIRCDRVIVDSLVGRHAEIVSDSGTKPDGMRVTVGENSSLRL